MAFFSPVCTHSIQLCHDIGSHLSGLDLLTLNCSIKRIGKPLSVWRRNVMFQHIGRVPRPLWHFIHLTFCTESYNSLWFLACDTLGKCSWFCSYPAIKSLKCLSSACSSCTFFPHTPHSALSTTPCQFYKPIVPRTF